MQKYGKHYVEDLDPMPFMVFDRDPKTKEIRANKAKSVIPKSAINQIPEEFSSYNQRDKDKYVKNQMMQETMENLIKMFQ